MNLTDNKFLDIEDSLQTLSEEMLKLKSASEHYDDTKESLLKICETVEKISDTHRRLAENMKNALDQMERVNLDSKKTREFLEGFYGVIKKSL